MERNASGVPKLSLMLCCAVGGHKKGLADDISKYHGFRKGFHNDRLVMQLWSGKLTTPKLFLEN